MVSEMSRDDSRLAEVFGDKLSSPVLILVVPEIDDEARLACNLSGIEVFEYEGAVNAFTKPEVRRSLEEMTESLNKSVLPESVDENRLAEMKMISPVNGISNLHKPPKGLVRQIINPRSLFNKAFAVIVSDIADPIDELRYEELSGGGVGEAGALARIYGVLATGGEELCLSPETVILLVSTAPPSKQGSRDEVMGIESQGSRAGYLKASSSIDFGSDQAFGFSGTGGSFAYADPEYGIGYAYAMNKMDFYGTNDPREVALREAMYRCIQEL